MGFLSGKPIVVPWDFSSHSTAALQYTIRMVCGEAERAPESLKHIKVVYVMPAPVSADPGVFWEVESENSLRSQTTEAFRKGVARHPEFDKVDFVSLTGDPGSRIASYAQDEGAELIVISSHGRTGVSRWLLGSVAERVVRLAACPVLVLKTATSESSGGVSA